MSGPLLEENTLLEEQMLQKNTQAKFGHSFACFCS